MTVAEASEIRTKEERLCRNCTHFVSGFCCDCRGGSNHSRHVPLMEKIKDGHLDDYR